MEPNDESVYRWIVKFPAKHSVMNSCVKPRLKQSNNPKADKKEGGESTEEIIHSLNTTDQVENVISLKQIFIKLEAEVTGFKLIITENFIEECNVKEQSVTYANAVKRNHASANPLSSSTQDENMQMKSVQGRTKPRSHHTLILTLNEEPLGDFLTSKVNERKRKIEKSLSPSGISCEVISFKTNKKGEIVVILPNKADPEKAISKLQEKGASYLPGTEITLILKCYGVLVESYYSIFQTFTVYTVIN